MVFNLASKADTNLANKVVTANKVAVIANRAAIVNKAVVTVSKAATVNKVVTASKATTRADINREVTNRAVTASAPSANRWFRSHRCALCRVPNP